MQIPGSGASPQELVERLLEFEASLDLADHTVAEGLLLWPLARWRVLQHAMQRALRQEPAQRMAATAGRLTREARYLAASLRRDPLRLRRKFDLLIFGSGAGVSVKRDGKWFGRINDYFALEYEDRTLVLDAAAGREFREPRYPKHVAFHDAIGLRAAVRARAAGRLSAADERSVERFVARLREALPVSPTPEFARSLTSSLSALAVSAPFLRDAYLRLFERTDPALVFLEDGSYGGQSFVFKWARDAGIFTAEFQHGMIVPTHLAYSYAQKVRENALYRPYLPQSLLTYGKFWSDNTRTASALVEIGSPHFEARRAELEAHARPAGRQYVMVSQPDSAAELVPLTVALRAQLPADIALVYRLHPNERRANEVYRPLAGLRGVQISDSGDIYGLLHAAEAVIGCYSTVLFEAVGFGRPAFIFATSGSELYMPRNFGRWFDTPEELAAQLASSSAAAIDRDHYFRPNWRMNYREFVSPFVRAGA